jgi:Flp pilus assembly protein TadD
MNRKRFEAVRSISGDPEAWYVLGLASVDSGRLDEATYALLHAVELAPRAVGRALSAAQRLSQAGCHGGAERILRRVLVQASDRSDVRLALIQLLLDTDQNRGALEEVGRALDLEPESAELRLLAAAAHDRLAEPERAADQLVLVLARDPDHLEANRRLGELLARRGDRQGALACWQRVVDLTGFEDPEAVTLLGIELSHRGEHQEAVALLSEVAERGGAPGHANLGMAELAADRIEQAVETFRRALELDPCSAQATCGLGLGYQKIGRLEEAVEAFTETERLAPDNPAGPLNLALVLTELGQREPARAALLRAAAIAPEDQEIRQALEQFLAPPAPPANAPAFDASISGDLKSFTLFDLLEFLRVQNKCGSLVTSSRQGAGIIRLWQGAVTTASAPGVPCDGDALIAQGITDRAQLSRVLFQQILASLAEMATWTEGAFSFHPEGDRGAPPISFSVQQVLLELMRQSDEAAESKNQMSNTFH